jgi:hypothetical protein
LPDFAQFELDIYVFGVSATYTRYGDVFLGKGISRQYWNPMSTGVSISDGWMLKCDPSRDDLNNFLMDWSAGASAYPGFGGGVAANPSGAALNVGVGAGRAKAAVSPGMINSYRGNVFGDSWK